MISNSQNQKVNIWEEKYNKSISSSSVERDIRILAECFPDAESITKTNREDDILGKDYLITLKASNNGSGTNGKQISIDVKNREEGTKKFW